MKEVVSSDEPEALDALSFAYQSAKSLFYNIPDRVGVLYRPVYEANARTPETLPLQTESEILPDILAVLRSRQIQPGLDFRPYWNKGLHYNAIEAFGAAVQSVDLHDAPLPKTILPPEADVAAFIDAIKAAPRKVRVPEQLSIALDITGNNLVGTVNLCWIATRFMGRGADQRAYPGIHMDADEVRNWNTQLAQFETYNDSGKNDAPGDNYYFWTHAFGAMVFSERGLSTALAQAAFSHGTEIMAFVRKHIAKGNQPNITAHAPASELGRAIGLTFANLDAYNVE